MNRRDFLKLLGAVAATVSAVAATVGVPAADEINDKSVLYLGEKSEQSVKEAKERYISKWDGVGNSWRRIAGTNGKWEQITGLNDALREASNSLDNLATSAGKASESVYVFNGSLSQVKVSQGLIDDCVIGDMFASYRSLFFNHQDVEFMG